MIQKILIIFMGLILITSCETDEQIAIVKAQKCLNETSVASASSCKDYLDGHTSKEAYVLRCAADFLAEGVNANQMATALQNRDQTGTQKNSLLGMMGVISFRTEALAQTAKSDCTKSGYSSYLMLAEMSVISSRISILGGLTIDPVNGVKPTQAQLTDVMNSSAITSPTEETKVLIGQAASTIQTNYCLAEKDTSKVCTTIATAIGSNTTSADIGAALLNALQSN